jgi:hypothetical protein
MQILSFVNNRAQQPLNSKILLSQKTDTAIDAEGKFGCQPFLELTYSISKKSYFENIIFVQSRCEVVVVRWLYFPSPDHKIRGMFSLTNHCFYVLQD